jgi:hypothetical protein
MRLDTYVSTYFVVTFKTLLPFKISYAIDTYVSTYFVVTFKTLLTFKISYATFF